MEVVADYQKSQFRSDPSNAVSGHYLFLMLTLLIIRKHILL